MMGASLMSDTQLKLCYESGFLYRAMFGVEVNESYAESNSIRFY